MALRRMVLVALLAIFVAAIISPVSFAGTGCEKDSDSKMCDKCQERAAKKAAKGDPLRKLGRGAANCITFPLEVPSQICKVNNNDGPVAAMTYGVVKGITMGIFRALVGAYEVLSFPIPLPEWYKPILTDPEFMFEDWNV